MMSQDFRLLSSAQVGMGQVLALVPGEPDDTNARTHTVFVNTIAFGFLEPCIARHWSAYGSPVLHKTCAIPAIAWQEIIPALNTLRSDLLRARAVQDLGGLGFAIPELRFASEQSFTQVQQGVAQLISELLIWLGKHLPGCGSITVVRL